MAGGVRVGRGAGALWARGAKKQRPWLGRGALQNFGGARFQDHVYRSRTYTHISPIYGDTITAEPKTPAVVIVPILQRIYINEQICYSGREAYVPGRLGGPGN